MDIIEITKEEFQQKLDELSKENWKVNLGDEVKDSVSGFKGIAVAKHTYLQGCDRVSVQPSIDKEGKLPEAQTFDEPQLETIKQAKVKRQASSIDPGGPEKYRDSGKIIG